MQQGRDAPKLRTGIIDEHNHSELRATADLLATVIGLFGESARQNISRHLADLQATLAGLKSGGFNPAMAKRMIHSGTIRRQIEYLTDLQSLANKPNARVGW